MPTASKDIVVGHVYLCSVDYSVVSDASVDWSEVGDYVGVCEAV